MQELIDKINARKSELRLELLALDKALEVVRGMLTHAPSEGVQEEARAPAPKKKAAPSKGFLSEEAKAKISAAQKRIWAERKRGWAAGDEQKRRAG